MDIEKLTELNILRENCEALVRKYDTKLESARYLYEADREEYKALFGKSVKYRQFLDELMDKMEGIIDEKISEGYLDKC